MFGTLKSKRIQLERPKRQTVQPCAELLSVFLLLFVAVKLQLTYGDPIGKR